MRKMLLCLLLLTTSCFLKANQLYVTNTNDNGVGSLRYAIQIAAPGDNIVVNIGNELVSHTINLQSPLVVSKSIIIYGYDINSPDVGLTLNQTNANACVMSIESGAKVEIMGVTFTGGNDSGIKVASGTILDMTNCTVENNVSYNLPGGGIRNNGTLNLSSCTIDNNVTGIYGGGIYSGGLNSQLQITNSTVTGNETGYDYMMTGAGIYIGPSTYPSTINSCTISYNISYYEGHAFGTGVWNASDLYCYNSIIAGNTSCLNTNEFCNKGTIWEERGNAVGPTSPDNTWTNEEDWTANSSTPGSLFTKVSNPAVTGYLYLDPELRDNGGPTQTLAILDINSIAKSLGENIELAASNGAANDNFGYGVAISADGNTAVIGASKKTVGTNSAQGAAYVFTRTGTTWSQQGSALADTAGNSNDYFGYSVAVSADGNTAVIGAVQANTLKGAAYIFTRTGTAWSQQGPRLTAADGAPGNFFGCSVAVSADGNTAVIGANKKTVGTNSAQGAAYVFTRTGTAWSQGPLLAAADGAAKDFFGSSVAVSADGNTAVIGAYNKTIGINSAQGAAYIFTRTGTAWSQQGIALTASNGAAKDYFGYSVDISADGNTAIVGAYNKTIGTNSSQGAAYIFTRTGTTWAQQPPLTALDGATGDYFGYSVDLSVNGNAAVVGAIQANAKKGAAYVFVYYGNAWSQEEKQTALADGAPGDYFGCSMAISPDGNTAIIGANRKTVGINSGQGAVYIFSETDEALPADQRGYYRDTSGWLKCIGAYEYDATP